MLIMGYFVETAPGKTLSGFTGGRLYPECEVIKYLDMEFEKAVEELQRNVRDIYVFDKK